MSRRACEEGGTRRRPRRTLAHARYSGLAEAEQGRASLHPRDRLSVWVLDYLAANPGAGLREVVDAAMQRVYSASPAQVFYTGGGAHTFANFEGKDNTRTMTVAEAIRRSVNLVFIRMMREVIDHYMYRAPSTTARLLENAQDPGRGEYLKRFADREGSVFMRRFYTKYQGKTRDEALGTLLDGVRVSPRAVTVAVGSVWPAVQSHAAFSSSSYIDLAYFVNRLQQAFGKQVANS